MFLQRLLTTIILVPLVLLAIYQANPWFLFGLVCLIVTLGGLEWTHLIPLQRTASKLFFVAVLLGVTILASIWTKVFLAYGLVFWFAIFIAILTFPRSQTYWGYPILVGIASFVVFPISVGSLVMIYHHKQGTDLIVYLLCLVWATDIGAYLIGKIYGRHKLIPLVSPGKTVEGSLGGLLLVMVVAVIGGYYFNPESMVMWYGMALATAFISMVGDLFISMLKRRTKIKDTGHIFPGHGGILDRLDSVLAALPLFYGFLVIFSCCADGA
jgi:phosphatidate cytidylyltransferase